MYSRQKQKTRSGPEVVDWGLSLFLCYKRSRMIKTGYAVFIERPGEYKRYFRIGRPFGDTRNGFNLAPAFWPCTDKMRIVSLLRAVGRPEGHGIRPHSLKVTTISALMTKVARWNADSPKLATRRNHWYVTANDVAIIYSRNVAQKLFVSNLAHTAFMGIKALRDMESCRSVFLETDGGSEVGICAPPLTNAELNQSAR